MSAAINNIDIENLVKEVIDCCWTIRKHFDAGYLESVYHKALCLEFDKRGINYKSEHPISISYLGEDVGYFIADIIVEDQIIIEIKATKQLAISAEAQLINYLSATGIENGILVNFGSDILTIKRKFKTYRNTQNI